MSLLLLIILFSVLGSVVSVTFAAAILIVSERLRKGLLPLLISFAAGTLLGAAFLEMLPKAIKLSATPDTIMLYVLCGIIVFFMLEKFVLWRHCHKNGCEVHNAAGPLILFGDALHNLIDGVVIASTFLVSIPAGIAVSIAVIAHEVPQEVGDFALLINYGFSRKKALLFNLLSGSTTLVGSIISYYALNDMIAIIPYVLGISASSFIYIALADILPGLNKKVGRIDSIIQFLLIIAGVMTIFIIHRFNH